VIGNLLGHYRILELLGKGGMGEVYLAEDTHLGRRVAVKVLSRELAFDADRRERFEREARAAAALNHPNIVTIHSVEEADGVPFLTLELVDGRTLDSGIPAGGMPIERLLACAIQLADAVGTAHQRGVTHRDLKPANVMITTDGRVKVLDFGLAKLKEHAVATAAVLPTQELTGEGRIVGTVAYMSPEQAEGRPVDSRSDMFSLGVMLFEMATGERPFKGDTQVLLLSSIIKDTPRSITDLKAELPRDLARIVKRCLNKDPEDRYQTAKDLRNDLRALKDDLASGESAAPSPGLHTPAHRGSSPLRARPPIVAIAAALLVIVAGTIYWRTTRTRSTNVAPGGTPFASVSLTRLTTTGTAGLATVSDDGRYVAYVVTEEGKAGLWLRQVATTSNVAIVPPADIRFTGVSFSPDGNHVYYSYYPAGEVYGYLYQVPVLGGGARRVLDDIDGGVSFEPGGKRFAFVRGIAKTQETSLIVADAQGQNLKTLVTRKAPNRYNVQSVAWSPDGRAIAVAAQRGDALQVDVVLVDPATGAETVIGAHPWRNVTHIAWLPGGKSLLINAQDAAGETTSQIWLMSIPGGEVRRITNDLTTYSGLSVTADGRVFVSVRNELRARIWIVGSPASDTRVIRIGAAADDGVQGLAWTRDGRLVVASTSAGNSDIWLMDADGRNRVQLTSDPAHDTWPMVTSDGRRVVFVSERGGARGLWVMAIEGGDQSRVGTAKVGTRPSLSSDGKWIYYTETGTSKNFRIPIDGGEAVPIGVPAAGAAAHPLPEEFHEPVPSPDGRMIAGHYTDRDQRGERIAIVPLDGGPPTRFPTVRIPAQWSVDGKSLLYQVTRLGASNLWRQPVAGGAAVQVTQFSDESIFGYAWSAGQSRWAIVRGNISSDVVLVSERR
jgi:serine/threonine protein kinase/Tol biopolymer transport system component